MSSASKGKSKADPTGPSIRVEEMPHELSREELNAHFASTERKGCKISPPFRHRTAVRLPERVEIMKDSMKPGDLNI
ncbi:hypothetical protein M378DRAFT_173345 [Amanita muscaria Koide BX008]|uniref:Uncharacterized protein n=1 Tax=Amanita muscaria (strain Koide BX008) TaxID=946122 RepID=A0A0C2WI22_AMAMK|nr:hypothetical protein M378DRAFT_173345 [Amanita muscaria Koide BX008]